MINNEKKNELSSSCNAFFEKSSNFNSYNGVISQFISTLKNDREADEIFLKESLDTKNNLIRQTIDKISEFYSCILEQLHFNMYFEVAFEEITYWISFLPEDKSVRLSVKKNGSYTQMSCTIISNPHCIKNEPEFRQICLNNNSILVDYLRHRKRVEDYIIADIKEELVRVFTSTDALLCKELITSMKQYLD